MSITDRTQVVHNEVVKHGIPTRIWVRRKLWRLDVRARRGLGLLAVVWSVGAGEGNETARRMSGHLWGSEGHALAAGGCGD